MNYFNPKVKSSYIIYEHVHKFEYIMTNCAHAPNKFQITNTSASGIHKTPSTRWKEKLCKQVYSHKAEVEVEPAMHILTVL